MARIFAPLLVIAACTASVPAEAPQGTIRFEKVRLHAKFISEGVAVADVDGDGRNDVLAGPMWFQAPDWRPHEIEPVKEFFPDKGYSESFLDFADDLNGDGRPDLIVVGFPGAPVRVYENPGKTGVHWPKWEPVPSCSNESPHYVDLDGDGRRELVSGFEPEQALAWFKPLEYRKPWARYLISRPGAPGGARFYHGMGAGDVNGDGRTDVVVAHGWYEAPPNPKIPNWRFHAFPKEFAGRPCAHMPVYDVDGDGDNDILASSAHARGIWWYEQRRTAEGGIEWAAHDILSASLPEGKRFTQTHAMVLADIDGDGLKDFVTGKRWYAHQGHDLDGKNPEVVLYWFQLRREAGKPRWIAHRIDADSGIGTQFEVTDVDGDGLLDIAISNKKGVFLFLQRRDKVD